MIWDRLERFADRLIQGTRQSLLLRRLAQLPYAYERIGFRSGQTKKGGAERLFRRVLIWHEKSLLRNAGRWLFSWLLRGSVSSLGLFLLVLGGLSLAGTFLLGEVQVSSGRFLLSLILLLSAVPLLASRLSCGCAILHGRILSALLLGFCGLSETLFESDDEGVERVWAPILLGALCAAATLFLHPAWVLGALLLPLPLALLLSLPELAAMLTLLLLPFFSLTARPSLFLLAALGFTCVAWLGKALSGKRQTRFGRTDLCVGVFALLFLLGGICSAGERESLQAGALRAALLMLSWFPMRGLLAASLWRARCICAWVLSSLAVSCLGIWQYLSGRALLAWVDLSRFSDIGGRVCAVFENPNILAVYLLLSVPLALALAWSGTGIWQRLIGWSGFFAGSLCLVLTWSRGAWLGWLLAVPVFLMLHGRASLSLLCLLPLPCLTAAVYLPVGVLHRFASIGSMAESSARYRLYTWRGSLRLLAALPFGIGVGDSAFHAVYPRYAVSGTERVMHAHNLLLQVAIELGIPAACLLLYLLWRLLRRTACFLLREQVPYRRALVLGAFCALLGAAGMGLFDHIWYHFGLFGAFWSIAALLFDLSERRGMGE